VDKRTTLDPDRFGYLSLHYVVRLGEGRLSLPEYKEFGEVRFEIQIRSILQHAWAEIEHDLGYKSEHAVPAQLRRRFSRLAGLLELADEEFAAIRHSLTEYTSEVHDAVRDNELNVPIDRDTMIAYVRESARLAQFEDRLAESLGSRRTGQLRPLYAEARANELLAVGFTNLNEIDRALERDGEWLWRFVRNWFQRLARSPSRPRRTVNDGVMLLYVAVVAAVQRDDPEAIELLDRLGVGGGVLNAVRHEVERAKGEAAG
jgi:putative GTP pyrophosphokinase